MIWPPPTIPAWCPLQMVPMAGAHTCHTLYMPLVLGGFYYQQRLAEAVCSFRWGPIPSPTCKGKSLILGPTTLTTRAVPLSHRGAQGVYTGGCGWGQSLVGICLKAYGLWKDAPPQLRLVCYFQTVWGHFPKGFLGLEHGLPL